MSDTEENTHFRATEVIRTLEGSNRSAETSLQRAIRKTAVPGNEHKEEETRTLRDDMQRTIAYLREQHDNQVALNLGQQETNRRLQEQQDALLAQMEATRKQAEDMVQLRQEVNERPRASSLMRWGLFDRMETDKEDRPRTVQFTAGADIPKPPEYKGYTQAHKREFIDAYTQYVRKVDWLNQSTSQGILRLPVQACIENKTKVRICEYDFKKLHHQVTEEEWKAYFQEATEYDQTGLFMLTKALSNLVMSTDLDPKSRVDKLLYDFKDKLEENNMILFDQHEPKQCIELLTKALRPAAFKRMVTAQLKSQKCKKIRESTVEFFNWLKPQCVQFVTVDMYMEQDNQRGGQKGNQGGSKGNPGGHKGNQGDAKLGNQKSGGSGGNKKRTAGGSEAQRTEENKRRCLKCQSPDHIVLNCSDATPEEAKELLKNFRNKRRDGGATIGGITVLKKPDESAFFLDAESGRARLKVITDFGASETVMSASCLKKLKKYRGQYVKKILKKPVNAIGFSGNTVEVKEIAVVNMNIQTKVGTLSLTNVGCWILPMDLPDGMGDILLSRKVMKKLGYCPQQLVENARRQKSVFDMQEDDSGRVDGEHPASIGRIMTDTPVLKAPEEEQTETDFESQCTPDWTKTKEQEEDEVLKLLNQKIKECEDAGASKKYTVGLRELLMEFKDCFRLELGKDPPVKVDPLEVRLKFGAEPVKCKARRYSPEQQKFLRKHIAELEEAGLIYKNKRSRWCSPPLIVKKPGPGQFRMTVDVRGVNACTERMVWPMPNLETVLSKVRGAKFFFDLDWFKGYWQLALSEKSQEMFSFITDDGIYTPTRVLMGGSDSVAYCQAVVQEIFEGLLELCLLVWLDDLLGFAETEENLLDVLHQVLERCRKYGLKLNPLKCNFWKKAANWCGRIISGDGVQHNPDRIKSLVDLPLPQTGAELQQFLCAVNWMRTAIPGYAKLASPLMEFMEKVYTKSSGRTKRKVAAVQLASCGWSNREITAVNQLKEALKNAVMLAHPDTNQRLIVCTDASEHHWGAVISQVPMDQVDRDLETQDHEPLMFLGGSFSGAAKSWAIVEKEAFAIVETCRRADFLLQRPGGFLLFTDHRNLQYIFDPTSISSAVPKYTADKLQRWAVLLMGFSYQIRHIPGEQNVWADLLSRWGSPLANICALTRVDPPVSPLVDPKFEWPTAKELEQVQADAIKLDAHWSKDLWCGTDGLWRDEADSVVIPASQTDLIIRLLVIAHFNLSGHRGLKPTMEMLKGKFTWSKWKDDVALFVSKCLHCASVDGNSVERPFGEAWHSTMVNGCLHLDFISLPTTADGFCYILVIKDDASNYVWLIPCKEATSHVVVDALLQWFASFGVCLSWVTDQGTHFKNQVITDLKRILGANHHFTTARCPWANGTVERVMREILRCCRTLLSEYQLPATEWDKVVSVIQLVLNQRRVESLANFSPVELFTCHTPMDPLQMVTASTAPSFRSLSLKELQESKLHNFSAVQAALEGMHKAAADAKSRRRQSERLRRAKFTEMANFELGDYVLYANVWAQSNNKLLTKWNGPAQVVDTISPWIYKIRNIITQEEREAHASRLKFYSDKTLNVTSTFKDMVAHNSEGHVVEDIVDHKRQGTVVMFNVKWRGLDSTENSWEPFDTLFQDIPGLVRKYLKSHQDDEVLKALTPDASLQEGGVGSGSKSQPKSRLKVQDSSRLTKAKSNEGKKVQVRSSPDKGTRKKSKKSSSG